MVTFPLARLNSCSWRYASLRDMVAIFKAVTASVLIFTLVLFLWERAASLPRTVLIIEWFVLAVMLGGPRLAYRIYRESRLGRSPTAVDGARGRRVILFGYCDEADTFIRTVRRDAKSGYALVGIFETNPRHVGRQLHGVPVLGLLESLPQFVEEARERGMAPERIIVAPSHIDREQLGEIVAVASKAGLGVDRLPNIQRLASMDEEGLKPQAVRLEERYVAGYRAVPDDDLDAWAQASARELIAEEPW
jgi:FlaA1/EpsC-like NDP-sugar epimerase